MHWRPTLSGASRQQPTPGSNCPCSIWDDVTRYRQSLRPTIPAPSRLGSSSAPVWPATSRACASTRVRSTREPTSATCGAAPVSRWRVRPSPTRRPAGWQTVSFATPVAIAAGTTYVASYHTDVGFYSADLGYFASTGFDNPPLRALATARTVPMVSTSTDRVPSRSTRATAPTTGWMWSSRSM